MADKALVKVERKALEVGDAVLGLVTMNRPEELNPLDWDTVRELDRVFGELASDPAVRVVAVTGAGRAFSAGGYMKKYQQLQRHPTDFPQFLADIHAMFLRIGEYPKPYVALMNGVSVAGGTELMLSCDLAMAGESARIAMPTCLSDRWAAAAC